MLRAIRGIDADRGGPLIAVLRKRLVGELLGDANAVAATLDPAFELVMHTSGTTVTLPGSAVVHSVGMQAASGVLMWTEFDDLVAHDNVIAAHGRLHSLLASDGTVTTTPIAIFLRFSGDRMTSEVAFMGEGTTETIDRDALPALDALREQLASEHEG
ncbi:hypothetical protein [Mycobacterium sp. M23085]|uniref:hypothetical protein n=1 Tax=Mycobacterium sp. M23085 TaxID=3378087 RepID=UPI003877D6CF